MKTIYKYRIEIVDECELVLNRGARLLTVDWQPAVATTLGNEDPSLMIWALVDTDAPMVPRRICIRGTGHPAHHVDILPHIGTVVMGGLVWHVFDGGEQW